MELLAPAGDKSKLIMAIEYGADAVYLASTRFGLRTFAGNFDLEELKWAVEYAHERGVKIYLTLNTMPREYEYDLLKKYLSELAPVGLDAMIIADLGVFMLVKEVLPEMEIHVSTQANAVSAQANGRTDEDVENGGKPDGKQRQRHQAHNGQSHQHHGKG